MNISAPLITRKQFDRFVGIFRLIASGDLPPNFTINPAIFDPPLKPTTYIMHCNKALRALRLNQFEVDFDRVALLHEWDNFALRTTADDFVAFVPRDPEAVNTELVVNAEDFEALRCCAFLIFMGYTTMIRYEGILSEAFATALKADMVEPIIHKKQTYLRKIQQ